MTTCPTCLLEVERCTACGEPLDAAAGVGVWHVNARAKRGTWGTRGHRHYHPACVPAEEPPGEPARPRSPRMAPASARYGPCPRCGGPRAGHVRLCAPCRTAERLAGTSPPGNPATDRCDVCGERLPVAELAYRTLPPRRSDDSETIVVGHQACLERQASGAGAAG